MSKYSATLCTTGTAGHLQTTLSEHLGHLVGVSGGVWPSATVLTDNRYGPPEIRAARDQIRRGGGTAWVEIDKLG